MKQVTTYQALHLHETHLVVVRGLTQQEVSTKVRQQGGRVGTTTSSYKD